MGRTRSGAQQRASYRLKALARNGGPPTELFDRRRHIRHEQTRQVMEWIKVEAERIAAAYPFSHDLAEGVHYIVKHWDLLICFLGEPLLPPDNNAAEDALRINALIRKNSMFFGSEDGAERAAVALTVLHSCRLAEIEPNSYLAQIAPALLQLRLGRKQDLASLTPAAVAAVRQATKAQRSANTSRRTDTACTGVAIVVDGHVHDQIGRGEPIASSCPS